MPSSEHWLSTPDAAEQLGIAPRTLYRMINEGRIAGYRFGRVIRLKRIDVEAFIEASRIELGSIGYLYPEPAQDDSDDGDGADDGGTDEVG